MWYISENIIIISNWTLKIKIVIVSSSLVNTHQQSESPLATHTESVTASLTQTDRVSLVELKKNDAKLSVPCRTDFLDRYNWYFCVVLCTSSFISVYQRLNSFNTCKSHHRMHIYISISDLHACALIWDFYRRWIIFHSVCIV